MAESQINVAVAQTAPGDDPAHNRALAADAVAQAAHDGAQLVVLPEYSNYYPTPFGPTLREHAEPLDGPFVTTLIEAASEHDVSVVAGIIEQGSERVKNTLVCVDRSGVVATSQKQHLYDAFGQKESAWVEPGALTPTVFDFGGIRFGLMTCYDLRFPEVARTLIDAGAEALIIPAQWVPGHRKVDQWETLLAARAIENVSFVIAADQAAPHAIGHSQIISPTGHVIVALAAEPGILHATLDATELQVRETNPALDLRRYRVVPR